MIREYQEPKGLSPDAKPLDSDYPKSHRESATAGSRALRNAILRLSGQPVPKDDPVPLRLSVPTPEVVRQACICPTCGAPSRPGLLIQHIQETVASYYRIHPSAMSSQRRAIVISHPRQVAMYLAKELTPKSYPEIGRRFGGRDHTTVMYACRAVQKRIETDAEIALDVAALRERLVA